jgi:HSP20 family protein
MVKIVPWRREGELIESPFRSLRSDMERLWRHFFADEEWGALPSLSSRWPAVDLVETPETFVLEADLPGLETKDVDIQVSGDILTISGHMTQERKEEGKNVLFAERSFGEWKRSFRLPTSADPERIEATMHNGVLRLTIGKLSEAKAKVVKVKAV